jgi:hypothetical protein
MNCLGVRLEAADPRRRLDRKPDWFLHQVLGLCLMHVSGVPETPSSSNASQLPPAMVFPSGMI